MMNELALRVVQHTLPVALLLLFLGRVNADDVAAARNNVAAAEADASDWRRTVDGWERRSDWDLDAEPPIIAGPIFHPAAVAALEMMVVIAGLLIFEPRRIPTSGPATG